MFGSISNLFKNLPSTERSDPTILIIDEVDVFFDEEYFGNSYCPSIDLKGENVSTFLNFVWNYVMKAKEEAKRKGNDKLVQASASSVIKSLEFKQLVK